MQSHLICNYLNIGKIPVQAYFAQEWLFFASIHSIIDKIAKYPLEIGVKTTGEMLFLAICAGV